MSKGFVPGTQFEEAFVGTVSVKDNIAAAAGGGQPNATQIVAQKKLRADDPSRG